MVLVLVVLGIIWYRHWRSKRDRRPSLGAVNFHRSDVQIPGDLEGVNIHNPTSVSAMMPASLSGSGRAPWNQREREEQAKQAHFARNRESIWEAEQADYDDRPLPPIPVGDAAAVNEVLAALDPSLNNSGVTTFPNLTYRQPSYQSFISPLFEPDQLYV